MTEPCLFSPPHEPFYCRIHADVRLRLTDERCRRGVTLTQPQPEDCGECMGWPGHHAGCSKYGIPRTEAGARLLRTLEDSIYNDRRMGGFASADIVAIEDEAEVRSANRSALRSTPAATKPDTRSLADRITGVIAIPPDQPQPDAGLRLRVRRIVLNQYGLTPDEVTDALLAALRSTPAAPEFGGSLASVQPTPAAPQPECSLLLADGTICVKRAGHSDDHGMALRSTPAAPPIDIDQVSLAKPPAAPKPGHTAAGVPGAGDVVTAVCLYAVNCGQPLGHDGGHGAPAVTGHGCPPGCPWGHIPKLAWALGIVYRGHYREHYNEDTQEDAEELSAIIAGEKL